MSNFEIFESVAIEEFSFLSGYGFSLIDSVKDNYGCSQTYKNNWLALRISMDKEGINVVFYKLSKNQIPPYPIFFNPADEFLVFNANDLLFAKTQKNFEQVTARLYEESYLREKIKELALLLRINATDVFTGNFAILVKIYELVVQRWREIEH